MNADQNILASISQQVGLVGSDNAPWQILLSAAIILIGLILVELVLRRSLKRVQDYFDKKPLPSMRRPPAVLIPFRLAATGVLLHFAAIPLRLPSELLRILQGFEAVLLCMGALIFAFQLINVLGHFLMKLHVEVGEKFPEPLIHKFKKFLRRFILIAVLFTFLYTQRDIFTAWLKQYASWRYLALIAAVALVVQAIVLANRLLKSLTQALQDAETNTRLRLILQATLWPINLLLVALALFSAKVLLKPSALIIRAADTMIDVLATLAVVLFAYRLIELLVYETTRFVRREDNLLDETFVQMIRLFARVIVIVIGGIYLIRAISGQPLSALLAGLGIGGIAVALAAQDTLKNFFGSIMIMLDKPFNVGQRIVVDSIDGVVENIGFRSTRVRTLTGNLVTVPNEKMATANVENIGRRPSIRRLANITLTYDTPPDKIERALEIIRNILDNHEGMHPEFPPRAYFTEFNADSLNIMMIYWYHPADYWAFTEFSQCVNLRIMRAFEAEGIEFAFPTTTTYLAHDNRRPLQVRVATEKQPHPSTSPGAGHDK